MSVGCRAGGGLETLIRGGMVLDGRGGVPFRADVALKNGRIAGLGDYSSCDAPDVVEAAGCFVAPGFIDVHSHSDAYILIEPSAASKVHQGVTTEVVGQCGASAAPLLEGYKLPADWRACRFPGAWSSLPEYFALLARVKPAVNIFTLTGHNTLRAGVMGYAPRPASPAELDQMCALLRECLEAGSRGLSTGLLYPPGKHAARDEVLALAKVVAEHDGVYATHMRNEGVHLLEALDEALDVARRAEVRLQISHLKTATPASWPLVDAALEKIEKAREEGVRVCADRYPYTAGCTDLDVLLPDWVFAEGPARELAWLSDPATRRRIREEVLAARPEEAWKRVYVGSTWHRETAPFKGRPLLAVAEDLGTHPVDALLDILVKDQLKTSGFFFGMSEINMFKILARPWVMPGSDASLRAPRGPLSNDHPHPRAYGAFARFLRYALEGRTVALPEAIRKMTSLPAGHFGLEGRGCLEVGAWADVVVFGPSVRDWADYETPHRLATGIEAVFVEGRRVDLARPHEVLSRT